MSIQSVPHLFDESGGYVGLAPILSESHRECRSRFTPVADLLTWSTRTVRWQQSGRDEVVERVDAPADWSDDAVRIVAEKYFAGTPGSLDRETSVAQMVRRVSSKVAHEALTRGYLNSKEDADRFEWDFQYLVYHQIYSPNSPVWFNVGRTDVPQYVSACYIASIEDDLCTDGLDVSIAGIFVTQAKIFKSGGGFGANYSKLRSKLERIGGCANFSTGPVSFMEAHDAFGGTIKSGGKTRRSASMRVLNVNHPDIEDFVESKAEQERIVGLMCDAGLSNRYDDPKGAYGSAKFQSANHSVRVTDAFMIAVQQDSMFDLLDRFGNPIRSVRARQLFDQICDAAWSCGDPGLQFDDEIQAMHTSPYEGRIEASNPCSEYLFLDDTSCNLGSLNLLKCIELHGLNAGMVSTEQLSKMLTPFRAYCNVITLFHDVLISFSAYPTERIACKTRTYRTIGVGYCGLGALLMREGLPYAHIRSHRVAAYITSTMTAQVYLASHHIGEKMGSYVGLSYPGNATALAQVLCLHAQSHRGHIPSIGSSQTADARTQDELFQLDHTDQVWQFLAGLDFTGLTGPKMRNAQATVLAPTGTIGFMMDSVTTGCEPDFAMRKWKKLAGFDKPMEIVNPLFADGVKSYWLAHGKSERANKRFDWPESETALNDLIRQWQQSIETKQSLEDIPFQVRQVFMTASPWGNETQCLSAREHIIMMHYLQPFLSGAISKTVNLPNHATREDIADAYMAAWTGGLKAIAVYRAGSKRCEVLTTSKQTDQTAAIQSDASVAAIQSTPDLRLALEVRVPQTAQAIRHRVNIAGVAVYLIVTTAPNRDGAVQPVEVFLEVGAGAMRGMFDTIAKQLSHRLREGADVDQVIESLIGETCDPRGFTDNPAIPSAQSVQDYVGKFLQQLIHSNDATPPQSSDTVVQPISPVQVPRIKFSGQYCREVNCGGLMIRDGSCLICTKCHSKQGGCGG